MLSIIIFDTMFRSQSICLIIFILFAVDQSRVFRIGQPSTISHRSLAILLLMQRLAIRANISATKVWLYIIIFDIMFRSESIGLIILILFAVDQSRVFGIGQPSTISHRSIAILLLMQSLAIRANISATEVWLDFSVVLGKFWPMALRMPGWSGDWPPDLFSLIRDAYCRYMVLVILGKCKSSVLSSWVFWWMESHHSAQLRLNLMSCWEYLSLWLLKANMIKVRSDVVRSLIIFMGSTFRLSG